MNSFGNDASQVRGTPNVLTKTWKASAKHVGAAAFGQGIDSSRLIYAMKVALAAVAVLYFAFLIDLENTFWALLTVPLVLQPQSGTTVWRSLSRFTGTVIGALVGLLFVAFFAQDAMSMIAALALWIFATGFLARFEFGNDAYAYGVAGLTALIIAIDTGANGDLAFDYAVSRTTETLLAIMAAFVIAIIVFPQSIVATLKANIAKARQQILAVADLALDLDAGLSLAERRRVLAGLSTALANIRASGFEPVQGRDILPQLRTETRILCRLLADCEAMSLALDPYRRNADRPARVAAARDRLAEVLKSLPQAKPSAEAAAAHAQRFRALAQSLDRDLAAANACEDLSVDGLSAASALYRMRGLAETIATFLDAEGSVPAPSRSPKASRLAKTRHVNWVAAIELGARPAIAFVIASLFWLASAWPSGQIVALLTGALALMIPSIAPRAAVPTVGILLGLGFVAMVPVGLLLIVLLPLMQSFIGFAVLIGSVIFVFFYICGSPHRLPIALGGIIMLAVGLQPANAQNYDPLLLVNIGAALMLVPFIFVASVTIFFPNTPKRIRGHLTRGTNNLLRRVTQSTIPANDFLGQSIDLEADYGGDLDLDDEADQHLAERSRSAMLVGSELFALRQNESDGVRFGAPDRLEHFITSASRKRRNEDPGEEAAALEDIVGEALLTFREGPPDQAPAAFRLAMAGTLVGSLVRQRRLALPENPR